MRKIITEETIIDFALLLILGYAVYEGFGFDAAARRLPLIVGIPTFVLSLMVFVTELISRRAGRAVRGQSMEGIRRETELTVEEKKAESRRELWIIGWLFALLAFIFVFGLLWAVPIFLVLFLWFGAHQSWKTIIFLSAGAWAVVYVVFVFVFKLPLYDGLLQSLLGS